VNFGFKPGTLAGGPGFWNWVARPLAFGISRVRSLTLKRRRGSRAGRGWCGGYEEVASDERREMKRRKNKIPR
jgi:hypothetical protein